MLYLTLLTPILALPAVLLMDRVERWTAGDTSRPFRPARTAPLARAAGRPLAPHFRTVICEPLGAGA